MESRTFQAREIKEALALVRRELGPDAVIVETRRVPGRALGLLGGSFVQVTASAPELAQDTTPKEPEPPPRRRGKRQAAAASYAADPAPNATREPMLAQQRAQRARAARGVRRSIHETIVDEPGVALAAATGNMEGVMPHTALRRRLLAALVPRELCEQWLAKLTDKGSTPTGRADEEAQLRRLLHRVLGAPFGVSAPASRVVALVGPTGVGKTTTIAKLAARAHLVERKRVSIISLDDQRIGGTTQLRAYAKLLGVKLTTAVAEGGLAPALAATPDADLILVDTAGLSPGRAAEFDTLAKRLTRAGEPVTTHLCIAASTRNEELDRILHLYAATRPQALLPTKLDEAVAIGTVLAAHARLSIPLSFATTGQQVPDDISQATPGLIIDMLLGGARA